MSIILVRHTVPNVADNVCYGQTDLGLAESFQSEALEVISKLENCEVLITSPLQRCRKLAEKIGATFKIQPNIDPRVREMDFGTWEGYEWSDIPRHELDLWAKDFLHARPHGGDSVAMLRSRTLNALAEYSASRQRYIVVTHSGVIKAALSDGDDAEHFATAVDFGGVIDYTPHQDSNDDRL